MGDPGLILDFDLKHVKTDVRRDDLVRPIKAGGQKQKPE
jgi:hypothetical protein